MTRFAVLVSGHLRSTARLRGQVAGNRAIAADNGMVHAETLGLDVELWVGDFDSATPELMARHAGIEREVYPQAKDASDSELAVDAAVRRGARDILLVGGFGGQSDHALSHVMLAVKLAREGLGAMVTSGEEEAYPLIPGCHRLDLPAGSRVSLIALSDLGALSLSGVQWPLDKRHVLFGSTLTMSNVVTGPAEVTLESGHGVIIAYPAE
ncbi:MAG: thiamine diphosphokinase [Hyphomicrobiales bacterium]